MSTSISITRSSFETIPGTPSRREFDARSRYRLGLFVLVTVVFLAAAAGCSSDVNVTAPSVLGLGGVHPGGINGSGGTVVGSGEMASETRSVGGFHRVRLSAPGTMYVERGAPSLRIEAEDNLIPLIENGVFSGELQLATRPGTTLQPTLPIRIYVTVPDLDGVALSGPGMVQADRVEADRVEIDLGGTGQIEIAELLAREVDVRVSGTGRLELRGRVVRQRVTQSGPAEYVARGLRSERAEISVSGPGSSTIRVSKELVARVMSIGSIYYIGSPAVTSTITGTGKVMQIGG